MNVHLHRTPTKTQVLPVALDRKQKSGLWKCTKSHNHQNSCFCNKWVFYTENSIHLQILHHSCNCIWPTSDHIWNTLYLYGTPINGDLSALWRECRSSHLRCALKAGVLDMSLCFSHATCLLLPAEDAI